MLNILFVCTGNICRSPMAEYYLKHLIETKNIAFLTTFSAGVHACAGLPASEHAITVMSELGIDLSQHQGKQLTSYMVEFANWIIVMEQRQKNIIGKTNKKVMLLSEFSEYDIGYDIMDPYGGTIEMYRTSRDRIIDCVDGFVRRFPRENGFGLPPDFNPFED